VGKWRPNVYGRDVETFQQLFGSLLQLRWLDKQVAKFRRAASTKLAVERLLQGKSSGAAYLQSMLQMREDPDLKYAFNAAAQHDVASIQSATLPNMERAMKRNLAGSMKLWPSADRHRPACLVTRRRTATKTLLVTK